MSDDRIVQASRVPAGDQESEAPAPGGPDQSVLHAWPVLATGFSAGLLLTVLLFLQQLTLRRSPFGEAGDWPDVWVAIVHCLMAGYVPAAYLATLHSTRKLERELGRTDPARDTLAGTVDRPVVPRPGGMPPFDRPDRVWLAVGLTGTILGFLGPWLTEPDRAPHLFWLPWTLAPETWWHRILGLWIVTWSAWYGLALIRVSRAAQRTALDMTEVDVFDPKPFRPFLNLAASQSFTAAGLVTFIGLLGLDKGITLMLLGFGGAALLLMALAWLLPMLGVRSRMVRAKQRELAFCEDAIARQRDRLRADLPRTGTVRLADLVAYRHMVDNVSAWCIDLPAARRFVLYLLIPLSSWVASSVIQEVIEQAILPR